MSDEHWAPLRAALQAAQDDAPAVRAGHVAEALASDPEFTASMAALLPGRSPADVRRATECATGWLCAPPSDHDAGAPGASDWTPGVRVGPYEIAGVLGAGGMGQVFAARDPRLGRTVALKRVLPAGAQGPDARARLLREARAAAGLTHPNIAAVYDVLEEADHIVIVMERVEGQSLKERLLSGPLASPDAIDLACQLADALDYAHSQGIVHCDIKPGNIHLTPRGVTKLLDFGIARSSAPPGEAMTGGPVTELAMLVGTPGYMAPEQMVGLPVDARSDVYALGIVLFEMLTGRRPFDQDDSSLGPLRQLVADAPDVAALAPDLHPGLCRIVQKAIAREPHRRYGSASDLAADLRALRLEMGQPAAPRPRLARSRLAIGAAAIAAIVALLLVTTWVRSRQTVTAAAIAPAALRWYETGVRALHAGAYQQAAGALERAVGLDPAYPMGWAKLAEARLELDDGGRAKDALLKVATLVPDRTRLPEAEQRALDATIGMVSRDYPAALRAYAGLVASQPPSSGLLMDYGRAHEANEDVEKAIAQYERAASLDPENPAPFLRLGVLRARSQDVARAQTAFDRAVSLYQAAGSVEGRAAVSYERGVMFNRLERPREARPALEQAVQLARSVDNTYLVTASLFRLSSVAGLEGHYDEAERLANEALASGDGLPGLSAFGLVDVGNVFIPRGDYDRARHYFRLALERAQRTSAPRAAARAALALGTLEVSTGDTAAGIPLIEEALPFYARGGYRRLHQTALGRLAHGRETMGELEQAQPRFEELLVAAQGQLDRAQAAQLHDDLARVLVKREQFPGALDHAQRSLALYRELGSAYDTAYALLRTAGVLWRLGRADDARATLTELRASADAAGNTDLERAADHERLSIALSEGRDADALALARKTLQQTPEDRREERAELSAAAALALARGRTPREAVGFADAAAGLVAGVQDRVLRTEVLLSRAEVLLRAGRPRDALEAAEPLAAELTRQRRFESACRAHAIVAQAARQLGDTTRMAAAAQAFSTSLTGVTASWAPQAADTYRRRADIARLEAETLRAGPARSQ